MQLARLPNRTQQVILAARADRPTQPSVGLDALPWKAMCIAPSTQALFADFWGLSMSRPRQENDSVPAIDWFPCIPPISVEVCGGIREECNAIGKHFRARVDPVGFFLRDEQARVCKWEQEWILLVNDSLCLYDNLDVRLAGSSIEDAIDRLLFSHPLETLYDASRRAK
jgi:hypothetical protein